MSQTRVVKELIQMATARLLGRTTAGAGIAEEISVGAGLTLSAGSLAGSAATDTAAGIVELATSAETVTGTDTSRAVTPAGFRAANIVLDTAKASTSGVNVDFTGIPSWAKRIVVTLSGVSTNGTSAPQIQLGTSLGVETTGYLGTCEDNAAGALMSSGFLIARSGVHTAASVYHGSVVISLLSSNNWCASGVLGRSDTAVATQLGGSKSLAATLDRVRITTVGGTDTFDAGTINVSWE